MPYPELLTPYLQNQLRLKFPETLLLSARNGGYLNRPRRRSWFNVTVSDAGLPHLTPHDLRHTAASLVISAGANVKTVQRMLGHASATMTLDTYADLFEDDLDRVAERINHAARSVL